MVRAHGRRLGQDHDHSRGGRGGDILQVAQRLDVPQFAQDSDAPDGSFFFNTNDNAFKYKASDGSVSTVTDQVIPSEIGVTEFGVGDLSNNEILENSGGSLSALARGDLPVTSLGTGGLSDGDVLGNSSGTLSSTSLDRLPDLYNSVSPLMNTGMYFGATYPISSYLVEDIDSSVTGQGTEISSFESSASDDLTGVAVDPTNGTLWVADNSGGPIRNVDRDGNQIGSIGAGTAPWGVSVDPADGTIWHYQGDGTEFQQRDRSNNIITSWNAPSAGAMAMGVDPADGTIWASDTLNNDIYHLERDGSTITSFNPPDTNSEGICVDPADGTLWNSDFDTIYHLERDGSTITSFSSPSGGLRGISMDPVDGLLWAGDIEFELGTVRHMSRYTGTTDLASYAGGTFAVATRPDDPQPAQFTQPFDDGTQTATGGSTPALDTTITNVGVREVQRFDFIVYVDPDSAQPSADYAFNYDWGFQWDNTNSEVDINLTVNWDTDPGGGNDVTLRWEAVPP